MRLIRIVNDARFSLKGSLNPRIPLEMAMLKMIKLDQAVSIDELLTLMGGGRSTPGPEPNAGPAGTPPPRTSHGPAAPANDTEGGGTSSTGRSGSGKEGGNSSGSGPAGSGSIDSSSANSGPAESGPYTAIAESGQPVQDRTEKSAESSAGSIQEAAESGISDPFTERIIDTDEEESVPLITLQQVEGNWDEIIQKVKHKKITVGSFLQEGRVLDVQKNDVEITFGRSNNFHVEAIMRNKDLVLEAVRDVLGDHVTFHCVQKQLSESEAVVDSKKDRMEILKELKDTKPAIKKIVDDFDVEIVD
jgi:hypothetical protein